MSINLLRITISRKWRNVQCVLGA